MEKIDFKLSAVISRVGPATHLIINRSDNTDIETLYEGRRVRLLDTLPDAELFDVKFIEPIDRPKLGLRIWVY